MFNAVYRFSDYLTYLLTAKTRHGIHSPFVYHFIENILQSNERHASFDLIENTRRKMISSQTQIDFVDLGSGKKTGKRKISEIASRTGKQAKYGRLLYLLLTKLHPFYSVELGTATGITALYQACALDSERPLHTIEGSEKLMEIAKFNAENCGLESNILFHTGNFDTVLPELLKTMPHLDYAFIDGNHKYEPTMSYFDMLVAKSHEGTVLVFDDIYYSEEMKQAWETIKKQPQVTVTIDIFAMGLVFFRKGQEKEHFTLRY